jgi:hypothetical protein
LKLEVFGWVDLINFKMDLIVLQAILNWRWVFSNWEGVVKKCSVNLYEGLHPKWMLNLKIKWRKLRQFPRNIFNFKKVRVAMLTTFSSIYACESFFSAINYVKSSFIIRQIKSLSLLWFEDRNYSYS